MKRLEEMSLAELWDLFPIFLTEHNTCWSEWYSEEIQNLKKILPQEVVYYHIGSTAVKHIKAKPIIDIIAAVGETDKIKNAAELLQKHGYKVMSVSDRRISMNKGYTENGYAEKVFHIHIRLKDDVDEIYFRDYLNKRPEVAKEYEALKLRLWKKFERDRDAYTEAKTGFVEKYTRIAKEN